MRRGEGKDVEQCSQLEASQYVLPSLKTSVNLRSSGEVDQRETQLTCSISLGHGPADPRAYRRLCLELLFPQRQHALIAHARGSQREEQGRGFSQAPPGSSSTPLTQLVTSMQVMCLSSRWRAMPLAQAGGTTQFSVAGGSKARRKHSPGQGSRTPQVVIYLQVTPAGDAEEKVKEDEEKMCVRVENRE